jgi:hypothetical protein
MTIDGSTSTALASHSNTWTNQGTSTSWNDGGNWSAGPPPGDGDTAFFGGADVTVTGTASVGALEMAGPQMVSFAINLDALGVAGQPYAVELLGSAQGAFQPGSQLVAPAVGIGSDAIGIVLTMVGSAAKVGKTVLGTVAGGSGALDIANSTWSNAGFFQVGGAAGAIGDLSVASDGELYVGVLTHRANMAIGTTKGSLGAVDASGGEVEVFGNITVGGAASQADHGIGVVNVGAGGDFGCFNGDLLVNGGSAIVLADGGVGSYGIELDAGATIGGSGSIIATSVQNNGVIQATGMLYLQDQSLSGTGTIDISAAATLSFLSDDAAATGTMVFGGPGATLDLEANLPVTLPLVDFAPGDVIDLANGVSGSKIAFDQATSVLTVSENAGGSLTLHLLGNYTGDSFHLGHSHGARCPRVFLLLFLQKKKSRNY